MVRRSFLLVFAIGIGIMCFLVGLHLASRRPLWNDELYTHKNSIAATSYSEIIQGKTVEGNNAPLFYLGQKLSVDLSRAKLRNKWKGEWFVHDRLAQVKLRLFSIVCISLAIAVMVYVLSVWFSFGFALMCVGLFLCAPSVWLYWIEARPYALWILLTVIQSLFFIKIIQRAESAKDGFKVGLFMINVLLSLTIAFGAVQSLVVYAVLWLRHKSQWLIYGGSALMTTLVSAFYYRQSPKFKYWFASSPGLLILENVPVEFWILGMVCVAWLIYVRSSGKKDPQLGGFLIFAGLTICSALTVLTMLKIKSSDGSEGFAISSRYFLFLIPVVSLALGFLVRCMWQVLKGDVWMRMNFILAVGGFLVLRGWKTYVHLLGSGVFMHVIQ